MRRINNYTIRKTENIQVFLTFADKNNNLIKISVRNSIVLPTELTLPENWKIPLNKKLSAWRQGNYEFRPGKAINLTLINLKIPFEAVYINCFIINFINPYDNTKKIIKYATGAFIKDFLEQTNFIIPEGMRYKGMLSEDNILYTQIYVSQNSTYTLYCEEKGG